MLLVAYIIGPLIMSNATDHLDINRLRKRAGEKPRTKVGQVRQAWPEIKNLLSAGHSLKDIWAWLTEIGLDIGYARLSHCINELRLRNRAAQAPIEDSLRGRTPPSAEHVRQQQSACQGEPLLEVTCNPVRNTRARRAKDRRQGTKTPW
jgi:hypothetical protein